MNPFSTSPGARLARTRLSLSALALVVLLLPTLTVHAGVVTDGTLGAAVALPGPRYAIGADLGRQRGGNLFHSFADFSLTQGEAALFSGPASIANIVARITGGSSSTIDGRLASDIPGASLFLLNPQGLFFGPNATLDLSGSFHASTADYLRFSDGAQFHAHVGGDSVLSIAPPIAFGFLAAAPAGITATGSNLLVADGRTLALVAGSIALHGAGNGRLVAPGGRIEVIAAGAGETPLGAPVRPVTGGSGDVLLDDGMRLDASAAGGRIVIRAGRLVIDRAAITSQATEDEAGGEIDIAATRWMLLDGATVQSATAGPYAAGRTLITTGSLELANASRIDSSTFGTGSGGSIVIEAGDLRVAGNSRIRNNVEASASGVGGDTLIRAGGTVVVDGAGSSITTTTLGAGRGGTLSISAESIVLAGGSLQAAATSDGAAGGVHVDVGTLQLSGGGSILAGTLAAGHAGNVSIAARKEVVIEGKDAAGTSSQIWVGSQGAAGDGGQMTLAAGTVRVTHDGAVNGTATGTGRAGSVKVTADALALDDGGEISTEAFFRAPGGGNIDLTVSGAIDIRGRSEPASAQPGSDRVSTGIFTYTGDVSIRADSLAIDDSGAVAARTWNDIPGGTIAATVRRLDLRNGGQINAESMGSSLWNGKAGDIVINATDSITIVGEAGGRPSGIRAGTRSNGDAGRIDIATPALAIGAGGSISTSTGIFGSGGAGEIAIRADVVDIAGGGITSGSSGSGTGGSIDVTASERITLAGGSISAFGQGDGTPGRISLTAPAITAEGGRISTSTSGSRPAGDIAIHASRVTLSNGSSIRSESTSRADAGGITIEARDEFRSDRSAVTTAAGFASGGNIAILAPTTILTGNNVTSATVFGGKGDGGNVTISGTRLVALGNSDLTARADQGFGGHITVNAQVFLKSPDIDLDASSNVLGNEGVVEVNAPRLDLAGAVVPLRTRFGNELLLLADPCGARTNRTASSLVRAGRGGLPPDPASYLFAIDAATARVRDGAPPAAERTGAPAAAVDCSKEPPPGGARQLSAPH